MSQKNCKTLDCIHTRNKKKKKKKIKQQKEKSNSTVFFKLRRLTGLGSGTTKKTSLSDLGILRCQKAMDGGMASVC